MRTRNVVLLILSFMVCSGCATHVPVAGVRLVGKAFQDLSAASAPLFDDLAVAERMQGKQNADFRAQRRASDQADVREVASLEIAARGADVTNRPEHTHCDHVGLVAIDTLGVKVQNGFCASDSYYYSELTDPPATAAFRRSIAAVESYTNVLLILAEGRNIEAAQAEVQSLAGNVGGVLKVAGVGGASTALQSIAGALRPLLELVAKHSNAKELARNVKRVSPETVAVIGQLRLAAPEVFATLTQNALARLQMAKLAPNANTEIIRGNAARIEAYRTAVSNYIVLLDQYERLLSRLVDSYDAADGRVTMSGLVQQSAELSAQADAWRRTYSALRLGF